jgi:hypothetical protein
VYLADIYRPPHDSSRRKLQLADDSSLRRFDIRRVQVRLLLPHPTVIEGTVLCSASTSDRRRCYDILVCTYTWELSTTAILWEGGGGGGGVMCTIMTVGI